MLIHADYWEITTEITKNIYFYSSDQCDRPRLLYFPNNYYLPKWVVNEKLSLLQAIIKINYRLKPEELKIDATIDNVKNKIRQISG